MHCILEVGAIAAGGSQARRRSYNRAPPKLLYVAVDDAVEVVVEETQGDSTGTGIRNDAVRGKHRLGMWLCCSLIGMCLAVGCGVGWWWKTHAETQGLADFSPESPTVSPAGDSGLGEETQSLAAGLTSSENESKGQSGETVSRGIQTTLGKGGEGEETWDVLLALGEFEEVLRCLGTAEKKNPEQDWRKALALEGLGRWEEAETIYDWWEGKVAGDLQNWMRLGKVRCRMAQGDWVEARRWRARVLLHSGGRDRRCFQECLVLHAQEVYQRRGRPPSWDPLLDGQQWAYPAFRPAHERLCEWYLHPSHPSVQSDGFDNWPWGFVRVEGSIREEAVEPLLTARWAEATVGVQLRRLCTVLGWELAGDSDALARLETVRTAVEVNVTPLGEILSALADIAGVHWRREGWKCLVQVQETGGDVNVFWRAWAWGGGHPWSEAVGLPLANECGNFSEGEWSRKLYRQVLEIGSPESQRQALYNWALLEWRQGRYAAARARWYDLLDSAPGTGWTPRAQWWLGRVALESGDLTGAEHHWQSVLRSQHGDWSAPAVLGLSLVYLLREDVPQLQRLLQQQRLPGREPYIAWADLLEAWSHYHRQPTPGRAEVVAVALERIAEASVFGAAGRYWAGQVWRTIGRAERMIHCYESQPLLGRNPWIMRMWNDVAEYYHQRGLITQSRQRDLALLAVDPDGWGRWAALRLAEAAWQQGQVEECIRHAQRLRHASPELQRAALLLLGRAYERARRYRLAAECFAGRWPNEQ